MLVKTTPRVMFVDQTGQLGGAELSLFDLIRNRPPGDQVVLFADGPFAELLRASGADVKILSISKRVAEFRKNSGVLGKVAALAGTAKLVRKLASFARHFDLLYANTPKAFVIAALASVLTRKPLIYHLRDILTASHFSAFNRKIIVSLANHYAYQVIANSQSTAEEFVAAGGDAKLVKVIYNGFDAATYEAALEQGPEISERVRGQLNLGAAPCFAVFGRLAPWKGQHLAIASLKQLPHAQLLLVGEALFGEQDYVNELHKLASAPAVSGRVHFLGFRRDVAELMQVADVVIHCSTAPEPFGRVIVEGMLSHRPVIASAAGGAVEIIDHEKNGLLTAIGCVDELAAAMRSLNDDTNLANRLAEAGYRTARQRFRLTTQLQEINRVIASHVAQQVSSFPQTTTEDVACRLPFNS